MQYDHICCEQKVSQGVTNALQLLQTVYLMLNFDQLRKLMDIAQFTMFSWSKTKIDNIFIGKFLYFICSTTIRILTQSKYGDITFHWILRPIE